MNRSARRARLGVAGLLAVSLSVAGAAALPLAPGASAAAPAAAASARDDGSQPLPGWTISNPPLAPLSVDGEEATVQQGTYRHAGYVVEKPARWNGELVMWAHGYRGTGTTLTVTPPDFGLRQRFLDQGYAWAASSYERNAYDVGTGVTSTRALAGYAGSLLGKRPARTYVAGVSMGGHVIGRSLEQYPRFYDGALPMCGVMGDQELFDFFLDYNLAAQDLADVPAYPAPADYLSNAVPRIQQELGLVGLTPFTDPTDARGVELRDITVEQSGGERPGAERAFALWKDFLFTLYTPDDGGTLAFNAGRLAQNLDTVYTPTTPVDINPTITRVAPTDKRARRTRSLTAIPQITGRPGSPVLSLHGLGDMFVPFSMEQDYARDVAKRRQSHLLVQRAIRTAGHCEFSEAEAGTAWDDLVRWVESRDNPGRGHGKGHGGVDRPAGDDVLDPAVVAAPTYGCRFSDGPPTSGSRPLFGPC